MSYLTRVMIRFVLFTVFLLSVFVAKADNQYETFQEILHISLRYNESVLHDLRQVNTENRTETLKRISDNFVQACHQTNELKEKLGKDFHLEDDPKCFRLMSNYRRSTLIIVDKIKEELYKRNIDTGTVSVIKHGISSSTAKKEDTEKQMLIISSSIQNNLENCLKILKEIRDKESGSKYLIQLRQSVKEHNDLSQLLYLYNVDDQESGQQIIMAAQSNFLEIQPQIEKEIERLSKANFFGIGNLKTILAH